MEHIGKKLISGASVLDDPTRGQAMRTASLAGSVVNADGAGQR